MSLLYIDGFDHYSALADLQFKFGSTFNSNAAISASAVRNGVQGLRLTTGATSSGVQGYVNLGLQPTQTGVVVGVAFRLSALPSATNSRVGRLITLCDTTGGPGIAVCVKPDGTLALYGQGAAKPSSAYSGTTIATNTWYYLEMKAKWTANTAAGDVTVRLNGTQVLSINSGQTTSYNSSSYSNWSSFTLGDPNGDFYGVNNATIDFDDLYVCSTSGTSNNDYLGDCKVETLYPAGAGASAQWTPKSGANYSQVNEHPKDGDTSYVSTSGVGNRDSYTLGSLASLALSVFACPGHGVLPGRRGRDDPEAQFLDP